MFLGTSTKHANPEFVLAIGRVAVELSRLEYALALIVAWFIDPNDDRPGEILTNRMSVKTIAPKLLSLYEHRLQDKTKVERLGIILEECVQLSNKRNEYIHGAWLSYLPLSSAMWQKTTGKGFVKSVDSIPVTTINELADEIDAAIEKCGQCS